MQEWITRAENELARYESWSEYCNSIRLSENTKGAFALVRYYQLEVDKTKEEVSPTVFNTPIAHRTRGRMQQQLNAELANFNLQTPVKKGDDSPLSKVVSKKPLEDPFVVEDEDKDKDEPTSYKPISPVPPELASILYPPTRDEQIVNTALVIFLNALTIHFPFSSSWTLHRKGFTAEFGDAEFEARTDGYLYSRGEASVLVEVKPVMRFQKTAQIQMQESAQMVAWIKNEDDLNRRHRKTRIHISQDRNEVYVTIAEYDEDYLAYLNDESAASTRPLSFLTMHQYGPWNTLDAAGIRELGPILLAISLRADAESRD